MSEKRWATMVTAALVILAAGVLVALAEEPVQVKVEVEAEDGDSTAVIEVTSGDVVEVFTADDLEDGEERVFQAGDRTVTVRRAGDDFNVLLDGEELIGGDGKRIEKIIRIEGDGDFDHKVLLEGGDANVWHMKDGEEGVKIIKIRNGEDGEELVWHSDGDDVDLETFIVDLEGKLKDGDAEEIEVMVEELKGHHGAIFVADGGGASGSHVIKMVGGPDADMVRYRCESTGSTLLVKQENATMDTLIDPATGCVMEKVESEDDHIMVVKTKTKVIEEDE